MKRKRESSASISDSIEEPKQNGSKKCKTTNNQSSSSETVANVNVRLQNTDMLTNYRNKNQHIQIESVKMASNFTVNDLSDDDEIWICEIPTSIDVNTLIGKSVKLGSKRSSIKTEQKEIECVSTKLEKTSRVYENVLSVVLPGKNSQLAMRNIKPIGRLTIHEKITDTEADIELTPTNRHECTIFPDSLTVRHPLFGRNFASEINVNEKIRQKLSDVETNLGHVHIKQEKSHANSSNYQKVDKSLEKMQKNQIQKIKSQDDDDLDRIKLIFETS